LRILTHFGAKFNGIIPQALPADLLWTFCDDRFTVTLITHTHTSWPKQHLRELSTHH